MIELKILEIKERKFILKKIKNCPWSRSKVPVGKETAIFVSENLIIGYPLMKKRYSKHRDNAPRSLPATSTVIEIISTQKEDFLYQFRTENSVYELIEY